MSKAFSIKKQQDITDLNSFMENVKQNGVEVLTDEQKEYLADNYNPSNMSQDEYQAFVNDLCKFGILEEQDKDYVSCSSLVPLDLSIPACEITKMVPGKPKFNFDDCNDNVLDWAKFRSTFESFDSCNKTFQKTRSAILFGKIEDVLTQIAN